MANPPLAHSAERSIAGGTVRDTATRSLTASSRSNRMGCHPVSTLSASRRTTCMRAYAKAAVDRGALAYGNEGFAIHFPGLYPYSVQFIFLPICLRIRGWL